MERYLVIALDEKCSIYKTLKKANNDELDKFTIKFEDSDDIRKVFKKDIDDFLLDNNKYIKQLEEKNGRKERGDIVLNGVTEEGQSYRIKVLYKKHYLVMKEIILSRDFMTEMVKYSKVFKEGYGVSLFSDFENSVILGRNYNYASYCNIIKKWYSGFKDKDYKYEVIRFIVSKYEDLYKKYNLKSIDKIYDEYLDCKKVSEKLKDKTDKEKKKILEECVISNIETSLKNNKEIDYDNEYIPDIDDIKNNINFDNGYDIEEIYNYGLENSKNLK